MNKVTRIASILGTAAALGFSAQSFADTKQQLLRCMETQFEQGAYGQYYGMTYHGTDKVCGGDLLGRGGIKINNDGTITVKLDHANHNPFVLYEVYWIPVGQDPVTHRVKVGNIMTDCKGNAVNALRDINAPIDANTAPKVDIRARVGNKDAGNFYFYSRGPWGFTDDGTCNPATYNTSDGTQYGTVANPVLWGGTHNPLFDGVQFISAYVLPEPTGSGSGDDIDQPYHDQPNHDQPDGSGDHVDPNYDPNKDPNYNPVFDPNLDPNFNPNQDPNFDPNLDPNFDPNQDPNFDPNLDPNNQ